MPREVRPLLRGKNHEEEDEKKDRESLDSGSQSLQKDGDKDHGHFPIHNHTLPVVGVRTIAFEKEAILALHITIL